jgi:DNA polymerase phi
VSAAADEPTPDHMDVLVEVLLCLTSKPSAFTRDAVERTFRAFAPGLTAEGLRCMLRVITRRSDGGRGRRLRGPADEDDEEEEEEEPEEEVEEDGAPVPSKAGRRSAPAESSEDCDDDSEEEAMDDDAMFRTDALLAAVLKETKATRTDSKSEAILHFKFRVISLIEAFVKAQPSSPLLLVRPVR